MQRDGFECPPPPPPVGQPDVSSVASHDTSVSEDHSDPRHSDISEEDSLFASDSSDDDDEVALEGLGSQEDCGGDFSLDSLQLLFFPRFAGEREGREVHRTHDDPSFFTTPLGR